MSTAVTSAHERIVEVADGRLAMHVRIGGDGPPLVYLHPAGGLFWDPFLERLASGYTVYAPEHPGTSAEDPYAVHRVDSWLELLLCYEELVRSLVDGPATVVGQSYGGMLAADLAAVFPDRVGRLVLLDPIGLWRDDAPIPLVELCASGPEELASYLFHDPGCDAAKAMFTPPDDPEVAVTATAAMVWALGCTGKFFWPIADHGLARRLYRVTAPTLVVWGREDALVPVAYAEEFAARIPQSQVVVIDDAGHIPQLEQTEATAAAVEAFLGP